MSAARIIVPVLIAGGVVAAVVMVVRSKKSAAPIDKNAPDDNDPGEKGDTDVPTPLKGDPSKPIIVGEATDPSVAPWIALMEAEFTTNGIDLDRVPIFPLIVMTKAPLTDGPDPDADKTRPVSIPPQEMWGGLAIVASIVANVLEEDLADVPVRLTGYRPRDYNAAVGGAPSSRHIYGDAIDVWLAGSLIAKGGTAVKVARERLRMAFARRIVRMSKTSGLGFGFGVYTNDIHLDVGRKPGSIVTWEQGGEYIAKAKAELNIA